MNYHNKLVFVPYKLFQPIIRNILAYHEKSVNYGRKKFYNIGPRTGMESTVFRVIRDVEFEVRVGPFATDLQKCKLTCVAGQWVGPLCRSQPGDNVIKKIVISSYISVLYTLQKIIKNS